MAKYADAAPVILQALEEGSTQKDAAEKAGIHIDTFHEWVNTKPEFSEAVHRAKENARTNAIAKVERSLLDRALGFEYEEVRTEYESKPNDDPKSKEKYVPVIKKQSRTKKRVVQDVEAIKFFLTNQDPQKWKNRQEHDITNLDALKNLRIDLEGIPDGKYIVESEEDIID